MQERNDIETLISWGITRLDAEILVGSGFLPWRLTVASEDDITFLFDPAKAELIIQRCRGRATPQRPAAK